jgi:hypothetical protein
MPKLFDDAEAVLSAWLELDQRVARMSAAICGDGPPRMSLRSSGLRLLGDATLVLGHSG